MGLQIRLRRILNNNFCLCVPDAVPKSQNSVLGTPAAVLERHYEGKPFKLLIRYYLRVHLAGIIFFFSKYLFSMFQQFSFSKFTNVVDENNAICSRWYSSVDRMGYKAIRKNIHTDPLPTICEWNEKQPILPSTHSVSTTETVANMTLVFFFSLEKIFRFVGMYNIW